MSKRGRRVKTGVVVPSRIVEFTPAPPLVPNIRCTATPPCGHCWYCKQHEARQ